jgi:hypothetical protein
MRIPRELRDQIYDKVLCSAQSGIDLILCCRQIYNETREILFRKPLYFRSQFEFIEWTARFETRLLQNVQTIVLQLQESDGGTHSQGLPSFVSARQDYNKALGQTPRAFRFVPNTKDFTMLEPAMHRSHFIQELQHRIFLTAGTYLPKLERLTFDSEFLSLTCVGAMVNLRSLRFPGYSLTDARETISILAGLSHLSNIEILARSKSIRGPVGIIRAPHKSITAEVLRNIRPLKSFIYAGTNETALSTGSSDELDLLSALQETHSESLRHVRVRMSHPPDAQSLGQLDQFRAVLCLAVVEIEWPQPLEESEDYIDTDREMS